MDEFGQPRPPPEQEQQQQQPSEETPAPPPETAEPEPEPEPQSEPPPKRPKPIITSHDETRVNGQRLQQPPSPAPFADYAPNSEKIVPMPGGPRPMEDHQVVEEEDAGAGCCKCVVM
jgi:hypothetical protein